MSESTDDSPRRKPIQEQIHYDKDGFQSTEYHLRLQNYLVDQSQQVKIQNIWESLLPQLGDLRMSNKDNERKLKKYVRSGVCDSLRDKIWPRLIIPPLNNYQECADRLENKQVDLDLLRTFPKNKHAKQIACKMRKVLNALAMAIPQLGYCQGMNFIVGTILLRLSEQDTYNVSFHILHWQRHQQLLTNMHKIHQKVFILQQLTKKYFPKLHKTLMSCSFGMLTYTTEWFVTLFTKNMPVSYALRVIECYLLEGEKVLYRVALQLLRIKKKLIKMLPSQDDIMQELKNFKQLEQIDPETFFQEAFSLPLSRKDLIAYGQLYLQEQKQRQKKDAL